MYVALGPGRSLSPCTWRGAVPPRWSLNQVASSRRSLTAGMVYITYHDKLSTWGSHSPGGAAALFASWRLTRPTRLPNGVRPRLFASWRLTRPTRLPNGVRLHFDHDLGLKKWPTLYVNLPPSGQHHTKTAPRNDLQQSEPLRAVFDPKHARWVYVKAKVVCFGSP